MEVMEVWVASIRLPAVFTAILAASEHGDGVQRVGLTVVIANPCSTPEAGETSVSYPAPSNTSIFGMEDEEDGWQGGSGRGKEEEKSVQVQSVGRMESKQTKECERRETKSKK